MGAYFGMELNAMATMLYGQRAEPWHAGADMWGSACQQLLATHGDLGAANAVVTTWPLSIGSLSQVAFNGQVVGSLASLGEWAAYTGAMSAALRLGGTALNAAQAAMPALQSGYDTAVALSGVPIIGPFAAQVAVGLQQVGAGMMEAVGMVMQAPTAVPQPTQGWQGPGGGAAMPSSPVTAASVTDVLDATDKLFSALEKGANLVQTVTGLAQSGSLGDAHDSLTKLPDYKDLPGAVIRPDQLTLAGGATTSAVPPSIGVPLSTVGAAGGSPGGIPVAVLAGTVGAMTSSLRSTPVVASSATGARIAPGSEPGLAGSAARAAAAAAKSMPAITPPMSGASGGGGSNEVRSGSRKRSAKDDHLRESGVQPTLQGRPTEDPDFTLPRPRRQTPGPLLDDELFTPHP
ncbi:hypothetical protein EV651_11141 [Kribbella sp. VKM Ac-2571]|uniref:hypothetical protein n=1 Tax=Kribbella sp. VKM Ac-2571 TaxID=2512222 RepID=UPI00105FBF5C|nr:hypothetical protein [Kribbella sp. VKM Ac-2571]TDO57317.1 hypothetical protein EV651_11141 [Kribbella sp. VKM Ac-2571]